MPAVKADIQTLERLRSGINGTVSPLSDALGDDFSELAKARSYLSDVQRKIEQRVQMTFNAYLEAENALRSAIYATKNSGAAVPEYYYKNADVAEKLYQHWVSESHKLERLQSDFENYATQYRCKQQKTLETYTAFAGRSAEFLQLYAEHLRQAKQATS